MAAFWHHATALTTHVGMHVLRNIATPTLQTNYAPYGLPWLVWLMLTRKGLNTADWAVSPFRPASDAMQDEIHLRAFLWDAP